MHPRLTISICLLLGGLIVYFLGIYILISSVISYLIVSYLFSKFIHKEPLPELPNIDDMIFEAKVHKVLRKMNKNA